MYEDADPLLARVRELAARFPESREVESWGRPTFRAGTKMFAVYGTHVQPHGLVFKPDPDERPALAADPRFSVPPYFGPSGWLALDLAETAPDWAEVLELLDSSYRQVALVRMRRALDAASPAQEPGADDDGASTRPPT
jgi:predicted DNA-binding protein (MmcQ/YjbR family)